MRSSDAPATSNGVDTAIDGAEPSSVAWPVVIPDRFAPVLAELAPLAERFAASGHRLYLVGGTVRDLLVGAGTGDFDIDLTTDARPPEIKRLPRRLGGLDLDPGREVRDDRRPARHRCGTADLRDHDVPGRVVHRRLAQAARRVRRRDRVRSLAARLHGERDGARAHRRADARARRSVRRGGRPRDPGAAHAARARGQLHRRSAADAARRPLHRRVRARARRRAGRRRRRGWRAASRSSRRSASATSSTS